ncbi:MAG: crossover junction endodeoxyribonuclease RuvC, partial [Bdellovibrionales bacterium]|nr:crossover junction endodeoxyribonuclease RuvC [Bdellovibrionales bacterium]
ADRLHELDSRLSQFFQENHPDVTVVEKIFLGKSADSAFKLGHARGICLMRARSYGSEVIEIEARRVKKLVTGSGSASKLQVKAAVESLLRITCVEKIDATDALSLALCRMQEQVREVKENKMKDLSL